MAKKIFITEKQFKLILKESVLYHGSHADFNEFDLAYVLSGWGQNAYGYGIYLSDCIESAKEYAKGGILYTTEVPDGRYLDSEHIDKKEAMNIAVKFMNYFLSTEYGKSAYGNCKNDFWEYECKYIGDAYDGLGIYGSISQILGDDKRTSEFLSKIGYIGIRCHATNGATGEKFCNYVIFNPKDIKITKKEQL